MTAKAPTVVVFDVDECLGSFDQPIQLYHEIMENHEMSKEDRLALLEIATPYIGESLQKGNLRPGIGHVMRFLQGMKDRGLLDHVVLFTNASNEYDWVDQLSDLIESITEAPEIISTIIARETSGRTMDTPDEFERQAKHLQDLKKFLDTDEIDLGRVIMFDDHIASIIPGDKHKARVTQAVDPQEIQAPETVFAGFFTEIEGKYDKKFVRLLRESVQRTPEQSAARSQKGSIRQFIKPLVKFFKRNGVSRDVLRDALRTEGVELSESMVSREDHPSKHGGWRKTRKRVHRLHKNRRITPRQFR